MYVQRAKRWTMENLKRWSVSHACTGIITSVQVILAEKAAGFVVNVGRKLNKSETIAIDK